MKYIVNTDDFEPHFKVDSIGVFGIGKSIDYKDEDHSWSKIKSIEDFEELNSDYINEHYGELQDEAYRKGYADGREVGIKDGMCEAWEAARKIIHMPEGELLNIFTECYSAVCTALQVILKYDASEAIEKLKAYEEKQKAEDEIKVGDEVERSVYGRADGKGIYLEDADEEGDWLKCLFWTGATFTVLAYPKEQFKKTGRHFDIASILEAMKK